MSTALRTYYRGATLVSLREHPTGQTRYYHPDYQGTTQCLTDRSGTVTDRFACDAWGVEVKRTGSSLNRQWYIGNWGYYRQVDQTLDYVRARWLSAAKGIWLSVDPIQTFQAHSGNPSDTELRYACVSNNPVGRIDPSGLWTCARLGNGKLITAEKNDRLYIYYNPNPRGGDAIIAALARVKMLLPRVSKWSCTAINGTFFRQGTKGGRTGYYPLGTVRPSPHMGPVYNETSILPQGKRNVRIVDRFYFGVVAGTGSAVHGQGHPPEGVKGAGGLGILVRNGTAVSYRVMRDTGDFTDAQTGGSRRRTAIGIRNGYIALFASDRGTGKDMPSLANMLAGAGFTTAYFADGGNSTGMYFTGRPRWNMPVNANIRIIPQIFVLCEPYGCQAPSHTDPNTPPSARC